MRLDRVAAAVVVATVAFWAYTQTLLPGVDLGDTGGFQAAVAWPSTSARQAYPLYYGLARPFVAAASPGHPARGLNLFSAIWGAVAVGLMAWLVATVTRTLAAGVIAAALLAFSYTFWSQAIIAEVYTLHLALIGACLCALRACQQRPTRGRLAVFFAIYACAFGNHLSMVLLLVPFSVFLVHTHPAPRELLRPSVIALAVAMAAAGALQYLPNLLAVWWAPDAPPDWSDRVLAFWFDTTKSDWRGTTILAIEHELFLDRLEMWIWDLRQQFGIPGLLLAPVGTLMLWRLSQAWATLVMLAFVCTTIFAITYNVGDTHAFFLPAHFFVAFALGAAAIPLARKAREQPAPAGPRGRVRLPGGNGVERRALWAGTGVALPVLLLLYAGWRAWDTWPVMDRHQDRRAQDFVAQLTGGIDAEGAVLVTQINWQLENALLYEARYDRPGLAWTRLADVIPHLPFFVRDNQEIGRDVVLTAKAAADVVAAYGAAFPLIEDALVDASLATLVERLPRGTPYVLVLLTPPSDERFDANDFAAALQVLTGVEGRPAPAGAYQVFAGLSGQAPALEQTSDRPFRANTTIAGDPITVRMESWLPADTFRRAGFGHVLRGRQRVLFIERGISLVWFSRDGSVSHRYLSGLYAPERRFRIPGQLTQLARRRLALAAATRDSLRRNAHSR